MTLRCARKPEIDRDWKKVRRDNRGFSAKLTPFTGYEDKNYRLDEIEYDGREGPTTLVLKISNPLEGATSGHLGKVLPPFSYYCFKEFQVKLAKVLNNSGIPAPKTFPSLDGSQISVEEVALGGKGINLRKR